MAQLPAAIPAAIADGVATAMPAIANVPVPVTTFLQRFTSMPDVYAGTYIGLLTMYTTAGAPPQSAQAQMTVTMATFPHDTVPNVFVYQDSQGMIRTVCCIHSTQAVYGHPAGPWDGHVLAFASEVVHGQVTTVILPVREFFSITDPTTVPTVHAMHANLAAAANINLLGPYTVGDADTKLIQSCRSVPVPHQYVPLLLHHSLNPIEAWNHVGMQILQMERSRIVIYF
jgi:hypothetical protein